MKIRRAHASDAEGCVDIIRAWIEETPWMPMLHTRASMESFWSKRLGSDDAWVLEEDAHVKGFTLRDHHCLDALYVARDMRCKGAGARLLAEAARSVDRLELWVFQDNTRAQDFYFREGFRELNRTNGENEEGLPDILMARYSAAS